MEKIGKVLVVIAMACLTGIFVLLSVHYDVFSPSFRDTPLSWPELIAVAGLMVGLIVLFVVGLGIASLLYSPAIKMFFIPSEVWKHISEKHGKGRHLVNVFLLAQCICFIVYALNLVAILEYLSGEHYRNMPTLGGFWAVLYAWIVVFGTMLLFGWLSGLTGAFIAVIKKQSKIAQEYETARKKRKK